MENLPPGNLPPLPLPPFAPMPPQPPMPPVLLHPLGNLPPLPPPPPPAFWTCFNCRKRPVFYSEEAMDCHNRNLHRGIIKTKTYWTCNMCGTIFAPTAQESYEAHLWEVHGEFFDG